MTDVNEELEHEEAFPRLTRDLLAVLEAAGERRTLTEGEVLSRAGEVAREFCVVIRGSLAGHEDHGSTTQRPIRVIGQGRFWGGTNLLTGQPAYLTTVAAEDSEVIVLGIDQLRGVIAANQQLGDLILGAFVARRALLIGLAAGLRLVGSRLSPDTRRLREFLARNRIPHGFVDVESDEQAEALLRELGVAPAETPLLLGGPLALRNPTNGEVAEALNLRPGRAPTRVADVLIVGAGPAGLGAAVYAASEGLSAVLVDSTAIGGQAGTSARIENYLGFPARDIRRRAHRARRAPGQALRCQQRRAGDRHRSLDRRRPPRGRTRRRRPPARPHDRRCDRSELSPAGSRSAGAL
jgi:thioredoxin reductase (NADPH)